MSELTDKRIAFGSAIKALGNNRIGGYLVKFTDENRRDLYGEYFNAATDYHLSDFSIVDSPVLFHHGLDETIKAHGIGKVDKVAVNDKGIWIEAKLKEHDEYTEMVKELLSEGVLGWSSGALPQTVRVAENGHIQEWAIVEASATHTPAMPQDTAISSIRSLRPAPIRGANEPRGLTLSTSGGTVSSVQINFDGTQYDLTKGTTVQAIPPSGWYPYIPDTGEIQVSDQLAAKLENSKAMKMLDAETRDEVFMMIQDAITEQIGILREELEGAVMPDESAERAAEDEAENAAVDAIDEAKMDDEEDVAKAFIGIINHPETVRAIAQAYMTMFMQASEQRKSASRNAIQAALADMKTAPAQSKKSQGGGVTGSKNGMSNIKVGDNLKYAHLTAADMAFGIMATRANSGARPPMAQDSPLNYVSEDYLKNLAAKAVEDVKNAPDVSGMKSEMRQLAIKNWQAQKATVPFRADELNASDITAQGLEWVGDYWSNEVWDFARETSLFDRLVSGGMMLFDIPQGSDSVKIPTAASDPTVYSAPQANDIDADDNMPEVVAKFNAFGTGSVTLTPGQLMLAMSLTTILGEDSVINTGAYVNNLVTTVLSEHIVKAILNGDTTTTTNNNINLNDGTPGTGISRPYYLVTDGFRHHGLVDTTGDGRDGGGTLTISDFLETMKLLPIEVRSKRQNLLFVIDGNTEAAALSLPEIATDDVRRTDATITSGVLQNVYGIDVVTTEHLPLTGTAGTIPGSGGTVGTILLPYLPYWAFAYKRRITLETVRNPYAQTDDYVASVRFGLKRRGADALAMTYNTTT